MRGEQSILLVNRRGFSTLTTCGKCRWIDRCADCGVAKITHENPEGGFVLICHHCGRKWGPPEKCGACGEAAMRSGDISDSGDLVAAFARAISSSMDPQVVGLGDEVDGCESELDAGNVYQLRRRIATIRSEAIAFRRFVAPNRDALLVLVGLKVDWLADEDRLHIREAADLFARMAEELEAIRERAALLHEQLTDLRAELVDQRSLMIAVVAFIFLPVTFVTGLLGMNVEGIPFAHARWAFWGVVAFCVLLGLFVLGWFGMRHWLRR